MGRAGEKKSFSCGASFKLNPEDFTAQEEAYVVPSLDLQPVHLKESWKPGTPILAKSPLPKPGEQM
jgi:hypothetical protein